MKTLAKILSLIILGTLVLSGCNVVTNDEQKAAPPTVVNADNVLDQQLFQSAVDKRDNNLCNKIIDKNLKQECIGTVDSLQLMSLANSKLDNAYCNKIKLERYKDACVAQVESKRSEIDKKSEEEAALKQTIEDTFNIESEAINKEDYTLCDQIKTDEKLSCKSNVITSIAGKTKDFGLCEKIGEKNRIESCKNFIK